MFSKINGIENLSDAAKTVLEGRSDIYDDVDKMTAEDAASFMGAASAAKEAGKTEFEFGGKTYPVRIGKDVASKIAAKKTGEEMEPEEDEETIKEEPWQVYETHCDTPGQTKRVDKEEGMHDSEEEDEEEKEEGMHEDSHGLSSGQKKLPPGLQKAILKKQGKKVDDSEEKEDDKEVEEGYTDEGYPAVEVDAHGQKRKNGTKIGVGEEPATDAEVLKVDGEEEEEKNFQTEGKMSDLHMDIKAGKSADEIIKANNLPNTSSVKKFIQGLIASTK